MYAPTDRHRPSSPEAVSLDTVRHAEPVLIRSILFDLVRARCARLGIAEGDVVRVRATRTRELVLETDDHRTIALERDAARFIQVTPTRRHYRRPLGPLPA